MGDSSGVDRVARGLFYLQIPLIAISTTLLAVIGWKIQPMLAEYHQLQATIASSFGGETEAGQRNCPTNQHAQETQDRHQSKRE